MTVALQLKLQYDLFLEHELLISEDCILFLLFWPVSVLFQPEQNI